MVEGDGRYDLARFEFLMRAATPIRPARSCLAPHVTASLHRRGGRHPRQRLQAVGRRSPACRVARLLPHLDVRREVTVRHLPPEVFAWNPALFRRLHKGDVAVAYDADLALLDPARRFTVRSCRTAAAPFLVLGAGGDGRRSPGLVRPDSSTAIHRISRIPRLPTCCG